MIREFIVINDIPFSRKRPRACGKIFYDPQKKIMDAVKAKIKEQWKRAPLEGPVQMFIYFYMPIPKSWSKKKRQEHIGSPHISRPDSSNLLKGYEDCMNGIVFHDDSQIYYQEVNKIYSDDPRVVIEIKCYQKKATSS